MVANVDFHGTAVIDFLFDGYAIQRIAIARLELVVLVVVLGVERRQVSLGNDQVALLDSAFRLRSNRSALRRGEVASTCKRRSSCQLGLFCVRHARTQGQDAKRCHDHRDKK